MGLERLLALLVLATLVGAKSSPWDWQKGSEDPGTFQKYEKELRQLANLPYFSRVQTNVSVRLGENAYLPCRVKQLRDSYMVTWMRVADVSVLSVGAFTFSSDSRFSVIHVPRPRINADDWTLGITNSQMKDSGLYECSVNTLPKISHVVTLQVEEMTMQDAPYSTPRPQAVKMSGYTQYKGGHSHLSTDLAPGPVSSISGPEIQYVSSGSTVGLECRITGLTSPPQSLYWKRGSRVLTAKERPGISLESEKVPGISTARLFLSHVTTQDSANYSCMSDLARPATVVLVVTRDHPGSALLSLLGQAPPVSTPPPVLALILTTVLLYIH